MTIYSPALQAGWTGSLETLAQSSTRIRGEESEAIMWADAQYINTLNDIELNVLMTQQVNDEQESEIYQLFVSKKFSNANRVSMGRFQKSDMSGFYIIDGILFNSKADTLNFNLYAGKPQRVEGFTVKKGKGIAGADLFIPPQKNTFSGKQTFTANHQHKLSIQHQQDDYSSAQTATHTHHLDRVGLTSHISIKPQAFPVSDFSPKHIEIDAAINFHLQAEIIEKFYFNTALTLNEKLMLNISIKHDSYPDPAIDFKSQFYKLFNQGEQSEFQSNLYFSPRHAMQHSVEFRYIQREVGSEGRGLAFDSDFDWSQLNLKSRLEIFDFMNQKHAGIYLNVEHALSSFSKLSLGSVIRIQQSQLRHDTVIYGAEMRWDWKIERDLLFYCSAEFINQDRFKDISELYNLRAPNDDYRLSVSLTKYWDTPWTL